MKTKRTKTGKKNTPVSPLDPRIVEALDRLDAGLMATVASIAAPTDAFTALHNISVAAKAASNIRSILMLGGDES
jgi:hypothetical protein